MYKRPVFKDIFNRVNNSRKYIQVLAGPRQTGKTTLARQLTDELDVPCHYASADEPTLKGQYWIDQQWEAARLTLKSASVDQQAVLVLDEIQKLPGWSETVKRLWDEDTASGCPLKVVILGSAPLLMRQGLTESLAGRFELCPITHWSYPEMRDAFGFDLEQYLFYGGYPGAAELIGDPERWAAYINESLIETTVSRDILLMVRIEKPLLLRRLFELGCSHSGRVLSYQKMIGQLQDVGNTTTLAHYLDLLESAGLMVGLQKYAGQVIRKRASSPKLLVLNTALINAVAHRTLDGALRKPGTWRHIVESAVGATLYNQTRGSGITLNYWAAANSELDFVLTKGEEVLAIEVKSRLQKTSPYGLEAFVKSFPHARKLLIGGHGMGLQDFFSMTVKQLF